MCLALALCLEMGIPALTQAQQADPFTEIFWNIRTSMADKGLLAVLVFLASFSFSRYLVRKNAQQKISLSIVNILIAGVWLMGESFRRDDSLRMLHSSYGQMLKSVIYFAGIAYGLNQAARFIYSGLETFSGKYAAAPDAHPSNGKVFAQLYRRRPFAAAFAILCICWLPHLVLAYPANFCYDAYYQLSQYFGIAQFTSHHPVCSTLLMGGIVQLGSLISGNFGIFLYVLLQTVAFAAVLAYMFLLMHELRAPRWLVVSSYVICVFVPYYTAYIGLFLKDNTYSYMLLLFMIELIYLFFLGEYYFRSKRHIALFAFSVVGTILFRNNGKYILYPTILFLCIYFLRTYRKNREKQPQWKRLLPVVAALLLVPAIAAEGISSFTISHYVQRKGSIREALSLPMQQTARYVSEYADEVTEEEKQAIAAVLDYDSLPDNYDPKISDPVKATFKYDASGKELVDYLTVWLKQFFKHPFVYVKATANQNYYLLYPFVLNDTIYINNISSSVGGTVQKAVAAKLNLHDVEWIAGTKSRLQAFYKACFSLPVLSLLSHPAFYTILLIWLSLFSIYRKTYRPLMISLPLWLSVGIIILSPVIQGHPRYAFPIIYAMPAVLAGFFYYIRNTQQTP